MLQFGRNLTKSYRCDINQGVRNGCRPIANCLLTTLSTFRESFSGLDKTLSAERTNVTNGLLKIADLDVGKQVDQRAQITVIGSLQSLQVPFTVFNVSHNQRQVLILDQHARRNRPCNTAVSILERMYLREPMMQPSRGDFGAHSVCQLLTVPLK